VTFPLMRTHLTILRHQLWRILSAHRVPCPFAVCGRRTCFIRPPMFTSRSSAMFCGMRPALPELRFHIHESQIVCKEARTVLHKEL
jgi:hypothetical protein